MGHVPVCNRLRGNGLIRNISTEKGKSLDYSFVLPSRHAQTINFL